MTIPDPAAARHCRRARRAERSVASGQPHQERDQERGGHPVQPHGQRGEGRGGLAELDRPLFLLFDLASSAAQLGLAGIQEAALAAIRVT